MRLAVMALAVLTLSCRHQFPATDREQAVDARADAPSGDTLRDGPIADTNRRDGQTGVEARTPDKTPPKPDASPCACQLLASGASLAAGMCVCDTTALGVTFAQCNALSYCPSGWTICSVTAYQIAYGASSPPSYATDAWIDGCMSGNMVTFLQCNNCSTTAVCNGAKDSLVFDCAGAAVQLASPTCTFALASYADCRAFGQPPPASAFKAYWQLLRADSSLSRVLCCQ